MRQKGGEKFEDMQREEENSKMVGMSPWGPGKGPKKIFEKLNFENFEEKNVFGNTYVVSRCRRGVWYILLRNINMEQQQHVVSSTP